MFDIPVAGSNLGVETAAAARGAASTASGAGAVVRFGSNGKHGGHAILFSHDGEFNRREGLLPARGLAAP